MIRRTTLAALAALICAAPLRGQAITSPYDFVETSQGVRAFGSYVFTDTGPIGIGPLSSYAAGLGYAIRVSGPFNVDLRAAYMPTTRRVYRLAAADSLDIVADPSAGLEQIGTADLDLLLIDAALRFDITGPRTWYGIQPYALIGAGGVLTVASDNAAEEQLPPDVELRVRFKNGFTGNVGAGIEWHASRRITVIAEARDILWKLNVPAGFFVPGRIIDSEQWVQTAHVSLGAAFRF